MKIWFWHKMIIIFGFLGEKCIRLEVLSILSQSEQIYQGLQLSQLYRNLYGEMSFWPQWRHHYLARKLKKFAKTSKKQLLRCGFFCSPAFLKYFHHVHYWKWWQFPFKMCVKNDCVNLSQYWKFLTAFGNQEVSW